MAWPLCRIFLRTSVLLVLKLLQALAFTVKAPTVSLMVMCLIMTSHSSCVPEKTHQYTCNYHQEVSSGSVYIGIVCLLMFYKWGQNKEMQFIIVMSNGNWNW